MSTLINTPFIVADAISVVQCLSDAPHLFLQPSSETYAASLVSAKTFLDPLASSITLSHKHRQRVNKKKRKRSDTVQPFREGAIHLRSLYLDGFAIGQVWQQAKRIIDATRGNVRRDLEIHTLPDIDQSRYQHQSLYSSKWSTESFEHSDNIVTSESNEEFTSDAQSSIVDRDTDGSDVKVDRSEHGYDSMDIDDDSFTFDEAAQELYIQDPFGLNDGFFSIDDFNAQTELLERRDVSSGIDENEVDDHTIDWYADPITLGKPSVTRTESAAHWELHGNEGGSTFGDIESQLYLDNDEVLDVDFGATTSLSPHTNDIKYGDFFPPPPRKASLKTTGVLPKTQPAKIDTEYNLQRAMADVRRDLFEDGGSDEDIDSHLSIVLGASQMGRSTHEKRKAKIADEIRRLQAANIAKKEWMLVGEARAAERPLNSLIENDLDFERIGKPVPVVTNESSEEIEKLVKRRIVIKEFDEIIRRLPDSLNSSIHRKGRVEIEETKGQHSLAELYEADHLHANHPDYVDQKFLKLGRGQAEIDELWKDIISQLDSLSNWHYKPKVPQAKINVLKDVATITMEEARPTASGHIGAQGTLAPQDIYNPFENEGFGGDAVLKTKAFMARDEMSRKEKIRRRRRQKKQSKKRGSLLVRTQYGNADQKKQLMADLKKGDVKLVDTKGKLKTVDGHRPNILVNNQGGRLKL